MQRIWTIDAFTNEPFKGNPAAVCIFDEFPEDSYMQNIAAEVGFSDSAFIKKLGTNHYHIRWFTPHSEAPLCGHATIAATHVLMQEDMVSENSQITFESLSGPLKVTKTNGFYDLDFPSYPVKETTLTEELREIAGATPIFNGEAENCLFMEFASSEELWNLKPNPELLKQINCRALIATSKDERYDFISRYFAPAVGIDEDPVCASAHCRLIPYWSQKLGKDDMLAYQASKRGGEIKCKNLGERVLISGEAVTVFDGKISINQLRNLRNVA